VPSCESEEQAANRETILEKIHQLEEKIRLEDNRRQWVSFSSGANCTIQLVRYPASPEFVAFITRQIVVLLKRRGMSLLHATTHPFRKILHLHL
jgi:hypothetical protein